MALYLSPDWIAQEVQAQSELPRIDGPDAIMQTLVTSCPDGETHSYWVRYEQGRIVDGGLGIVEDPTATFVGPYEVGRKIIEALQADDDDLAKEVQTDAFARGSLSLMGDVHVVLALMRDDAAYWVVARRLAKATTF